MTPPKKNFARFGLVLGMATMLVALPAAAQEATTGSAPERTLSSYLRSLADNPHSLSALMGAGRAALDLGDAQAALTFFGRAEEIAPADGRIKMWIGSALVQLEQPSTALRFFDDARILGVPEADYAGDRGLAYDLGGDPARAQRDYALALRQAHNPEVTRRMALSLAISAKKAAALDLLQDQLKRQDRAAWRVRAFVLALTGDVEGANRAAHSAMPAAQAAAMAPFLARLPSLSMAERAMAVHFGRIPGAGRTLVVQAQPGSAGPGLSSVTEAGRPDSRQPPLGTSPASSTDQAARAADISAPRSAAAASISGVTPPASEGPASRPLPQASAQPQTAPLPPSEAGPAMIVPIPDTRIAAATPAGPGQAPLTQMQGPPSAPALTPAPVPTPAPARVQAQAQAEPPPSAPPPTQLSMADIAAAIAALRDDPPGQAPPSAAQAKPAAASAVRRVPPARAAAPPAKAKPAEPTARARERHWVQVAGGAAKGALPREYARLKAKAPALLGKRVAWTTPANTTNRLLVGPFDNEKDAQAFVNDLAKADVAAFSWTSPAGQEIERLSPK